MKCNPRDIAAATAVVLLVFALSRGMIFGREKSDLLFYACALAQAALAIFGASLAIRRGICVLAILVVGAALLRLLFVLQEPTLSGDVYRYIWDGRVINAGFNPYLHVPVDPALTFLRDPEQFQLIDKRDYAVTIYPPVAEAIFAIVTRFSASVWAMKLAMVLFEACAVLAMIRLLRRLEESPGWIIVYLLHPAPIWEIAGNGHVDAAMMAFTFGAFAWIEASRHPFRAAIPMTLGALVKPTGALGLPALWRPVQILLPLFVFALVVLLYLPFSGAGTGVIGFLPSYAKEQGLVNGEGIFWLALVGKAGYLRSEMVPIFVVFIGLAFIALALWTRRRGASDIMSQLRGTAILLVAAYLLITPTFPWYFLAALPMTPLIRLWSPFVLATGGFLLYGFHADAPAFFNRWAFFMGVVVVAVVVDWMTARKKDKTP